MLMLSGLILLYGHCSVKPALNSGNTQVLLMEGSRKLFSEWSNLELELQEDCLWFCCQNNIKRPEKQKYTVYQGTGKMHTKKVVLRSLTLVA